MSEFKFNQRVIAESVLGSVEQRAGRLLQIRKGVGAFGSDVYFIRKKDGGLGTFENVRLLRYHGEIPVNPGDAEDATYTIKGDYPEVGFIIDEPKQPDSENQSFSMVITKDSAVITEGNQ